MEELIKKNIKKGFRRVIKRHQKHDFEVIEVFKYEFRFWDDFINRCVEGVMLQNKLRSFLNKLYFKKCRNQIESDFT